DAQSRRVLVDRRPRRADTGLLMSVVELPPVGYYLAHEAGRLAGVSGRTIGQWARRGYIQSSQSTGRPRVYSYQDVAEAMIVHELLERQASHKEIKTAIADLRKQHGRTWPLTGEAGLGTITFNEGSRPIIAV